MYMYMCMYMYVYVHVTCNMYIDKSRHALRTGRIRTATCSSVPAPI